MLLSGSKLNFFWLVIFGLTLPVSVVISTQLARRSFENVRLREQTINVRGFAEQAVTSDVGQWSGQITVRNKELAEAYKTLDEHRTRTLELLESVGGFKKTDVGMGTVGIDQEYTKDEKGNRTNTIEYYVLRQTLFVQSSSVATIEKVSREVGTLIRFGIELDAYAPRFLFSGLEAMKLEMIAAASSNARERATRLIASGGGKLGGLRSASQGVFQITPPLSTDVSDSGQSDTTSVSKVVKAVVSCEFAIQTTD